jgi:hypothetical protein
MVTTPCQIYVLFKIIDLTITTAQIFKIYKEDGKSIFDLSFDLFELFKNETLITPFVEKDLLHMATINLLNLDRELIYLEINKLLWNIKYRDTNILINNYKLYKFLLTEPDTIVFEYRRVS